MNRVPENRDDLDLVPTQTCARCYPVFGIFACPDPMFRSPGRSSHSPKTIDFEPSRSIGKRGKLRRASEHVANGGSVAIIHWSGLRHLGQTEQ